jgi:PAS domain S-box-containing protein
MFKELPAPYMILDKNLCFIDANNAYLAVTSRQLDELVGRHVFDAFPESPERTKIVGDAFRKALAGETILIEGVLFQIARAAEDGGGMKEVCWHLHHMPIYDNDGAVVGVMQKATDVTAEVEAEQSRDIVLREFDHRIKNMLSKVTAIAHRTAVDCDMLEDFLDNFNDRINALANTQNLLMRRRWSAALMSELVAVELAPYNQGPNNKKNTIEISGPPLLLRGNIAQAFGMALHELTTNAAKYGALSLKKGKLNINWSIDKSANQVIFDWTETGFSIDKAPKRKGFGSTIIDIITPREIHGTVKREFDGQGHQCQIRMPYDHVAQE